jgi:hypothetical protein
MRAATIGTTIGALMGSIPPAILAFNRTSDSFALLLEHEDVFPAEVFLAAMAAAAVAGAFGGFFGVVIGITLSRIIVKRKERK